jgi:hypothetical protein
MKKIPVLLFVAITFFACKKAGDTPAEVPYKCAACTTTPQALAANDASSKGIYKGIVIGSTGTIVFDINNSATTITAVMVLDGKTVNLVSNVTWTAGQPYVAPFTGTLNGSAISITFSVSANGGSPIVTTSSIPGHPSTTFSILKETSTSLIECFEGTYSTTKPETGIFNVILSRNLKVHSGTSRKDGTTTNGPFNGSINAANELIDASNNKYLATLSGDNLTGTFVDGSGSTVTVKGKRTF